MQKEKNVIFRIEEALFQKIKRKAKSNNMTVSQFIRLSVLKTVEGPSKIEKVVNKASIESVAIGREILKRIDPKAAEQIKEIASAFYSKCADENTVVTPILKKEKPHE
ncbi:MAG: hypothetical protein K0R12_1255 [Gammaproteobacteria bacterium]|jgi:hypothetical protein|nr:hypothetical protein [Gammaproteobacteria bacterium]